MGMGYRSLDVIVVGLLLLSTSLASASDKSVDYKKRSVAGAKVAYDLTRSFNQQQNFEVCKDKPEYHCNGLMVSAFEKGTDPYWMHSGTDGRLSFSYFRNDNATPLWGSAGYILFPQVAIDKAKEAGASQKAFETQFRCAYPTNGYTVARRDDGCGMMGSDPNTASCQSLGIVTADLWMNKYATESKVSTSVCTFMLEGYSDADKRKYFSLNTEIQKRLFEKYPQDVNWQFSEIVAGSWPSDVSSRVPVIALFYVADGSFNPLVKNRKENQQNLNEDAARELAKIQQSAYYKASGIFVPLVKISGPRNAVIFTYSDDEQASDIPSVDVKLYPE